MILKKYMKQQQKRKKEKRKSKKCFSEAVLVDQQFAVNRIR